MQQPQVVQAPPAAVDAPLGGCALGIHKRLVVASHLLDHEKREELGRSQNLEKKTGDGAREGGKIRRKINNCNILKIVETNILKL